MRWPTAVDLFCGCGGVTAGLKRRNFRVVAAVDNDPVAARTFRTNHPTVKLFDDDIAEVDPTEIRAALLKNADVDLLVVCAPCQPFSSQNGIGGSDSRAELVLQAVRFARVLGPALIFLENVPGLAGPRFIDLMRELRSGLTSCGYQLGSPIKVDAADYSVPQRRLRCVLFAARKGRFPQLPDPVTTEGARITVRNAIANLPMIESGESYAEDDLHSARSHRPIALKRLENVPPDGGDRFSLPNSLRLDCHKGHKGHPDVYGRMAWDDVAPTLTTGCTDITRGRFAHPISNRAISLREAARLQTFHDGYKFEGSNKDIAVQIGNAVPVELIVALAPCFRQGIRLNGKD